MPKRSDDRSRVPTLFDVARLAGVSHQTVSRVVNDHPNVKASTRRKVQEAVDQLRYRPNTAARMMVSGRSRTLGLITTGSPDYGPTSTVLGLMAAARAAGYHVAVATATDSEPAAVRSAIESVNAQHVEAIAVVASRRRILHTLAGLDPQVPVVLIESGGGRATVSVSIDQYAGALAATEHLIEHGHVDIVHVAGPEDALDAEQRVRGWRDAMAEHGLVARAPVVGDWSPRSGFACAEQLLAGGHPFTAVFVANDQMALGLSHALRLAGRSLPDDVSVVGFDDIPEAAHFYPPLTTIRQDFTQLGLDVVDVLLALVDGAPPSSIPQRPPELVVRESVVPFAIKR